jgi:glucose-6-phosphate dehydrogenase assembly protein OpcA
MIRSRWKGKNKIRLTTAMMSLLLTALPLHADWRNDASEEEKIANLTTLVPGAAGRQGSE